MRGVQRGALLAAALLVAGWGHPEEVTVYVNGAPVVAEVPARIVAGRTFLPLRAAAGALGLEVAWQPEARTVLLVDPRAPGYYEGPDLPFAAVDPPAAAPAPGDPAAAAGDPAPAGRDPAPDPPAPAVAGLQVQARPGEGLVAVRPDGSPLWRLALPGLQLDRLALAGGTAWLAYHDQEGAWLAAVDAATGDHLWQRGLPAPAAALLPWGEVALVAAGNRVLAFAGALGAPVAWAPVPDFPAPVAGLTRRSGALGVVLADGQERWFGPRAPLGAIRLRLNGRLLYPDVAPFIEDGRTLVPVRLISAALGARVSFDPATRTVRVETAPAQ